MTTSYLDIAVGVLLDDAGRVLIARRRPGKPGAGKWEFPGGKREPGEPMTTALARELYEELGIEVLATRSLMAFSHKYPDRTVWLDIRMVTDWRGEPHGREGQELAWCKADDLRGYDLLSANAPVVQALRLPSIYAITPEFDGESGSFAAAAAAVWRQYAGILRLRSPALSDAQYESLAHRLQAHARAQGASLVLDRDAASCRRVGAAGLHWPASRLLGNPHRPVSRQQWFGVSCHDRAELELALAAGADFATLSPVARTPSHPGAVPLGWAGFARLRDNLALPVYALGGLDATHITIAHANGAQGVAGIRGFWPACSARSD